MSGNGRLRLHPAVERLVIFGHLPFADAGFADEQNEGVSPPRVSSASCAVQAPPARRFEGAKKTLDAGSLRSMAALSRSASVWSGE